MKKIYSLLFLAVSFLAAAQGSENFSNAALTASYADGSFVGNNGITWTYGHSRNEDTFGIDGNGIMLRRGSDSFLEAIVTAGGIGSVSFQYKKAFTGNSPRQIEVLINGNQVGLTEVFGTASETTVHTFSLSGLNITGSFTMRFKNVGTETTNKQAVIDNISWTAAGVAGIKENNIAGLKLFPNPLSGNVLNITSDSNADKTVVVYDVLGKQVINTKSVNGTVNASALTTGVYIVKITEEGKTATRKLVVK